MIILLFVALILLVIIFIFASPKLSPIPYFPSNHHDLFLIIKALNLQNNQIIVDLGAGDGVVIFKSAEQALKENLNTKFVAIDINPVLVFIMNIRRLFHPNKKNIKIIHENMFTFNFKNFINFNKFTTFYLYVSPWLLEKTLTIIKNVPGNKNIVSYFYPIKSLKPKTQTKGIHNLYTYKV